MKEKLIELQRRLRTTNKTIEKIEERDDKFHMGVSQLRVEIETINNELLKIIIDSED